MAKKKKKRNYQKEYDYQGTKKQKIRRAARNSSRADQEKKGKVRKGDGKDVHHIDGNPKNKKASNLRVVSKSKNRSFKRTKNARKKA
jgi:hypothetical protein